MPDNKFLSVSDFAKFSRTTRDTLHHYDKMGLLSPTIRGKNKYRYYSSGQLSVINVIRTLQALGMTLAEIKSLISERTPERMTAILASRIDTIDQKIAEWISVRRLLVTLLDSIHSAMDINEKEMTIQQLPAETIVIGEPNNYGKQKTDFDELQTFYRSVSGKYPELNLNYPVWGIFSQERIKQGDWAWPDRFYSANPDGPHERPAAFYAVGYTRGGYGNCGELYKQLLEFIEKQGFEICGDAYEEYPLNELCIADDKNYLIRVLITVQKKPPKRRTRAAARDKS